MFTFVDSVLEKLKLKIDRIIAGIEHFQADMYRFAGFHQLEDTLCLVQVFTRGEAALRDNGGGQVRQGDDNVRIGLIETGPVNKNGIDQDGVFTIGMRADITTGEKDLFHIAFAGKLAGHVLAESDQCRFQDRKMVGEFDIAKQGQLEDSRQA